jgi:hypothetical protein
LKPGAVVVICVDRHQVGTDNGTRRQAEGDDILTFTLTEFREVRLQDRA